MEPTLESNFSHTRHTDSLKMKWIYCSGNSHKGSSTCLACSVKTTVPQLCSHETVWLKQSVPHIQKRPRSTTRWVDLRCKTYFIAKHMCRNYSIAALNLNQYNVTWCSREQCTSTQGLPCFMACFSCRAGWIFSICFVRKSILRLKNAFESSTFCRHKHKRHFNATQIHLNNFF